MKEFLVTINFHYHGNWSVLMKTIVERYFNQLYGPWTEIVNPHYEEWNAEWHKLYPDANINMDERNDWWYKYNCFIADKARPLEDELNDNTYKNGKWYNKLFKVETEPDDCGCRIISRLNDSNYMTFDMTPVNE